MTEQEFTDFIDADPRPGPLIAYRTTDSSGTAILDRIEPGSWNAIDPRERTLCLALLRYTLDKLDAPKETT